jgi:hypothetical protein
VPHIPRAEQKDARDHFFIHNGTSKLNLVGKARRQQSDFVDRMNRNSLVTARKRFGQNRPECRQVVDSRAQRDGLARLAPRTLSTLADGPLVL